MRLMQVSVAGQSSNRPHRIAVPFEADVLGLKKLLPELLRFDPSLAFPGIPQSRRRNALFRMSSRSRPSVYAASVDIAQVLRIGKAPKVGFTAKAVVRCSLRAESELWIRWADTAGPMTLADEDANHNNPARYAAADLEPFCIQTVADTSRPGSRAAGSRYDAACLLSLMDDRRNR